MDISALFNKMIVLFIAILAGYVAAKTHVINERSNKAFSDLISYVTTPLQVLGSVMVGERLMSNRDVLVLSGIACGCFAALLLLGALVPRLLRAPRDDRGVYHFMFAFSNMGFMGYPVVTALFGEGARFYVTVFVLFFQLIVWSIGVQLIAGGKVRFTWRIFRQPGVISALLAYILYLTGLQMPKVVGDAMLFIGDATSPLAMIVIGCSLAQIPFAGVFTKWRVYVLAALKMILMPLAVFFLLRLFITNEMLLGVTTVMLAMPVATNTTIICYQQNADGKLASAGVFLTTLLSVATIPVLMTLLFGG